MEMYDFNTLMSLYMMIIVGKDRIAMRTGKQLEQYYMILGKKTLNPTNVIICIIIRHRMFLV